MKRSEVRQNKKSGNKSQIELTDKILSEESFPFEIFTFNLQHWSNYSLKFKTIMDF